MSHKSNKILSKISSAIDHKNPFPFTSGLGSYLDLGAYKQFFLLLRICFFLILMVQETFLFYKRHRQEKRRLLNTINLRVTIICQHLLFLPAPLHLFLGLPIKLKHLSQNHCWSLFLIRKIRKCFPCFQSFYPI